MLKMAKDDEIMARMMSEQLKLTPRRANLAMRTRVLIFYILVRREKRAQLSCDIRDFKATYKITNLFLVSVQLSLLQDVLLSKRRAKRV
jgi:hypothetical protein